MLRRSKRCICRSDTSLLLDALPEPLVEHILSFLPVVMLLRVINCIRPLRPLCDIAAKLHAERLEPNVLPPLAEGESLLQALLVAETVGATSTAWKYKSATRSTVLVHVATGATIALCHESVGWLRYQVRAGSEERICWSSGAWNPQDFSREESNTRDDKESWQPLVHLLRGRTVGSQGRSWLFSKGKSGMCVEFCNEYFNQGRDSVHRLDTTGASLRVASARNRNSQCGERLGDPLPT